MASEKDDLIKVPIEGIFDDETLAEVQAKPAVNRYKNNKGIELKQTSELVQLPDGGGTWKMAYDKLYDAHLTDLEIELEQILQWEPKIKSTNSATRKEARAKLEFHYKQAVAHCSPKYAAGWNRWSDDILEMFLSNKLHKVLWGSGNCGKSAIMGLLLYLKWRVNPPGRMIVIASRIVKDAASRVFGYIKDIHSDAPPSTKYEISIVDNNKEKGIYHYKEDPKTKRTVKNDRACILSLPVKVNVKAGELGSNLLGKHPDEWLCICFDESQELPGQMLSMNIFQNWYTNDNIEIFAWGNPQQVDFYDQESHDLLFKLGAGHMSKDSLRKLQNQAMETFIKTTKDTYLLHLTMNDSPRDDADEMHNYIELPNGNKQLRLHFIAGKEAMTKIAERTSPNSPSWYAQVLGFPYIDMTGQGSRSVLSAVMVKKSREYPLKWHTPETRLEYFMGVDPSLTGHGDDCVIVIGRMGEMMDGRKGLEIVHHHRVKPRLDEDFIDTTIDQMYMFSQKYGVPLKHIAIETHGCGDVFRYAIQQHIESGRWLPDTRRGEDYHIPDPTQRPTDRMLFKTLGRLFPSTELVANIVTEYWTAVRCAVLNRQIFGMPEVVLSQFYNRHYVQSGPGAKWRVENKAEMKKRGVKSPNDGDALCYMLDVARKYGFQYMFYNHSGYVNKHGPHAEYLANEGKVKERMGMISQMLNIQNEWNPGPVARHRRKKGPRYSKYDTPDV